MQAQVAHPVRAKVWSSLLDIPCTQHEAPSAALNRAVRIRLLGPAAQACIRNFRCVVAHDFLELLVAPSLRRVAQGTARCAEAGPVRRTCAFRFLRSMVTESIGCKESSMTTYSDHSLCHACMQSRAMLERITRLASKRPPKESELIETLPLMLEMTLSLFRKAFDFDSETHIKAAGALIVLAVATERARVLAAMREPRRSRQDK